MAVSAKVFVNQVVGQFGGAGDWSAGSFRRIDWLNDTIKVMLLDSSWTPSQTGYWDPTIGDLFSHEVSGTGYTSGGATLGSKTATKSSAVVTLDAADTSWTTATITARYAVVYKTGAPGTQPLIGYVDFGSDQTATAGTFTITWNASGMFTYTL